MARDAWDTLDDGEDDEWEYESYPGEWEYYEDDDELDDDEAEDDDEGDDHTDEDD